MLQCPSPFVVLPNESGTSVKQPNPHFNIWKRYDKLLMSWLLASISESMFSHVSKCGNASVVWSVLENYFVTESKVKVVKLKDALQNLKKGSMSTHEYIRRMKDIAETLGASGQTVLDEELLNHIIDGLGLEFNPAIVYISSKLDSLTETITLAESKFILQIYEQRIHKNACYSMNIQDSSNNVATKFGEKRV